MQLPDIRITHPGWVSRVVDFDSRYTDDDARVRLAVDLARENVERRTGGPFGAAVIESESGRLVAVGTNSVVRLNNSAAHAEMVALMMAQARVSSYTLGVDSLPAHTLYSSCEPCAMCLGATLWSGVTRLVFAATREDATRLEFEEGPVFPESYEYLARRGVTVEGGRLREEANAVFALYLAQGGPIYNG